MAPLLFISNEPKHAYSHSLCVYLKEISLPICSPVCRFILLPPFLSTAIFCLCVFFSYDLSLFLYCQIPRDFNCWMMRNVSIIVDFSEKSVSLLCYFWLLEDFIYLGSTGMVNCHISSGGKRLWQHISCI